jgi:ribosomal subunit interface protein
MKIQISNRHETANPNIKSFIEAELETLADRYDIIGADVILDREGHTTEKMFAEINVHVKGSTIVAKEKSENVEKSVDLALRSLEKQLQRHKETHYSSLSRNSVQK